MKHHSLRCLIVSVFYCTASKISNSRAGDDCVAASKWDDHCRYFEGIPVKARLKMRYRGTLLTACDHQAGLNENRGSQKPQLLPKDVQPLEKLVAWFEMSLFPV